MAKSLAIFASLTLAVIVFCGEAVAAGAPTQLLIASGDKQTEPAGTRLPGPVCVLVRDVDNAPVKGVSVTWGTITGGGSLVGATELTDGNGIATLGGWSLGPTAGTNTITATSDGLTPVTFTATATDALPADNIVIQWNTQLLLAFQNGNVAPTVSARALGILHTSIFDAWAAYDARAVGTQLGGTLRRPQAEWTDANKTIAISYAAYRTLLDLFPAAKSQFDNMMFALQLDPTNVSTDTTTPAGVGNVAAAANLTYRHGDGTNQLGDLNPGAYTDYTSYAPINDVTTLNNPSKWQPLLMNGVAQTFTTVQWGLGKAFALSQDTSDRIKLSMKKPAVYPSKAFEKQSQDVLDLSANFTDLTKTTAAYWVDKAGTVTPSGHWFQFAQVVSRRDKHTIDDDVKLFFEMGNAMLDVSVEVWELKRYYESVRPITSIRFLFKGKTVKAWGGPGLGTQSIDGGTFSSYIPTPAFPEYLSGHSTFSAAGAQILLSYTKSPKFNYSVDIPVGYVSIELNTPAQPITFTWPKFIDAANDAGMSRRYGGIHFKDGDLQGRALGKKIAKIVFKKAEQYINGKVK